MESIRVTTDDLMSVGRAAKALGISRMTLYRWIDAGNVVTIKLGGILFIPASEVNERLEKQKPTAGKPQAS